MKKIILCIATLGLTLCTIVSFGLTRNVYAANNEDVLKTYNDIVQKIDKVSNKASKNFSKDKSISDKDAAILADLNNQLYELVENNPNQFKNAITTDEDKENDLKNKEILEKIENDDSSNSISTYDAGSSTWNNYGDILTCSTNLYKASFTGHSGMGAYQWGATIESYPSDGVQYRDQYYTRWKNDSTAGMFRPYNTSSGSYGRAYDYAKSKVGEIYNASFNSSGSGYYCSELVYFCWKHADNKHIRVYDGENYIWPWELGSSANTYEISMP